MSWSRENGLSRIIRERKDAIRLLRDTIHGRLFVASRSELIAEITLYFQSPRCTWYWRSCTNLISEVLLRRKSIARYPIVVVLFTRLRSTTFVHSNRRRITLRNTLLPVNECERKNTLVPSQQISPFSRCIRARHGSRVDISRDDAVLIKRQISMKLISRWNDWC